MLPRDLIAQLLDCLVCSVEVSQIDDDPRAALAGPRSIQIPTEDSYNDVVDFIFSLLPGMKQSANDPPTGFKSKIDSTLLEDFVKKAVLTQHAPIFLANFPSVDKPDKLPYPKYLADKRCLLQHVSIVLHLMNAHYPLDLYLAQDNIHRLKEWFPKLKSVVIKILVAAYDRAYYKRKTTSGQVTSIIDEAEKLVEAMQDVNVKDMYVVVIRAHEKDYTYDKPGRLFEDQVVPSSDKQIWFKLLRGAVMKVVGGEIGVQLQNAA